MLRAGLNTCMCSHLSQCCFILIAVTGNNTFIDQMLFEFWLSKYLFTIFDWTFHADSCKMWSNRNWHFTNGYNCWTWFTWHFTCFHAYTTRHEKHRNHCVQMNENLIQQKLVETVLMIRDSLCWTRLCWLCWRWYIGIWKWNPVKIIIDKLWHIILCWFRSIVTMHMLEDSLQM